MISGTTTHGGLERLTLQHLIHFRNQDECSKSGDKKCTLNVMYGDFYMLGHFSKLLFGFGLGFLGLWPAHNSFPQGLSCMKWLGKTLKQWSAFGYDAHPWKEVEKLVINYKSSAKQTNTLKAFPSLKRLTSFP